MRWAILKFKPLLSNWQFDSGWVVIYCIRPIQSKQMDMRFKWLLDSHQLGQLQIYFKLGITTLTDFFTRHHPPAHRRNIRGEVMTCVMELQQLCQKNSDNQWHRVPLQIKTNIVATHHIANVQAIKTGEVQEAGLAIKIQRLTTRIRSTFWEAKVTANQGGVCEANDAVYQIRA